MDICPRRAGEYENEHTCEQGREHHPYSCKSKARQNNRPYSFDGRIEAAAKQDYTQSHHTGELRRVHIIEVQAEAVDTKHHAYKHKHKQQREAGTIT